MTPLGATVQEAVLELSARGGRIAAGGGLFAGGPFAGGPFAGGLIAGGLFASGLNAATREGRVVVSLDWKGSWLHCQPPRAGYTVSPSTDPVYWLSQCISHACTNKPSLATSDEPFTGGILWHGQMGRLWQCQDWSGHYNNGQSVGLLVSTSSDVCGSAGSSLVSCLIWWQVRTNRLVHVLAVVIWLLVCKC